MQNSEDEDQRPDLSDASSQTKAEIEREHALHNIEWATRELAANMIRVTRGAGRKYDLLDQVVALHHSIANASSGTTVGHVLDAMEEALGDGLKNDDDDFDDSPRHAHQQIERGVLRKVAARLLRQPLQINAGDREFREGLKYLDQSTALLRERREREAREARQNRTPSNPQKRKPKHKTPKQGALVSVAAPNKPKSGSLQSEPLPKTTAEYLRINAQRMREGKPRI